MQLSLEASEARYRLRGVGPAGGILFNDREILEPFLLSPQELVEGWSAAPVAELDPSLIEPILALQPALVILGCGSRQGFLPPATQAAFLGRGIGVEVMVDAAAARTFNVLAAEGRRVVAAFVLAERAG
jgi:uncharacterized protein